MNSIQDGQGVTADDAPAAGKGTSAALADVVNLADFAPSANIKPLSPRMVCGCVWV